MATICEDMNDEGIGSEEWQDSDSEKHIGFISLNKTKYETIATNNDILNGSKVNTSTNVVFGGNLIEMVRENGGAIPKMLEVCAACIEQQGLVYGVYRLSGSSSCIKALKSAFESGQLSLLDPSDPSLRQDVHSLCSILKLFFRELQECLTTSILHDIFCDSVRKSLVKRELEVFNLKSILTLLPKEHCVTLAFLMGHLNRLARHSEITGMNERNLAIVWAPNLFRDNKSVDKARKRSNRMKEDVALHALCTEMLIVHYNQLFLVDQLLREPGEVQLNRYSGSLWSTGEESFPNNGESIEEDKGCHKRLYASFTSVFRAKDYKKYRIRKGMKRGFGSNRKCLASFNDLIAVHKSNEDNKGYSEEITQSCTSIQSELSLTDLISAELDDKSESFKTVQNSASSSGSSRMSVLSQLVPRLLRRSSAPAPLAADEYSVQVEINHQSILVEHELESTPSEISEDDWLLDFESAWQEARARLELDVYPALDLSKEQSISAELAVAKDNLKTNEVDLVSKEEEENSDQPIEINVRSEKMTSKSLSSSPKLSPKSSEDQSSLLSMTEEMDNLWTTFDKAEKRSEWQRATIGAEQVRTTRTSAPVEDGERRTRFQELRSKFNH